MKVLGLPKSDMMFPSRLAQTLEITDRKSILHSAISVNQLEFEVVFHTTVVEHQAKGLDTLACKLWMACLSKKEKSNQSGTSLQMLTLTETSKACITLASIPLLSI